MNSSPSKPSSASALQSAFDARLSLGLIRPDPAQALGLASLVRLESDLAETGGLLARFRKPESRRGVYLWGPVGRASPC